MIHVVRSENTASFPFKQVRPSRNVSMLDQNLWAICGFGSGLNISFLTHQCLGSTEPVTSEVWKRYIYRHVLTVKASKIISNVVVSSFVIIYHVLLTAIWRMFQILPVAGRSAAEVQMASLGEFVCGQQVPYVEARVPRGLRWHIGGREHCALDIRYDQRWIDGHTERTKLNKLNNKRQNMTWTYWMKIHEIRGTCTNILDAPK